MGWLTTFTLISDYHNTVKTCWDLIHTFSYSGYYSNDNMIFYVFAKGGYLFFSLAWTNPWIALGIATVYICSKTSKKVIVWGTDQICKVTGMSIRSLNRFRAKNFVKN